MSGEASQVGLDADVLSTESEYSSRTVSRRPTQSGASPGGGDRPRPPWKSTSSTPKLLEATRKVLKASRSAKNSRPECTQTDPLPCVRMKDSSTQTQMAPGIFTGYYPGHVFIEPDLTYITRRPPKAMCKLLMEIRNLLGTLDKISEAYYEPDEIGIPYGYLRSRNLEMDLMRSCRELDESVKRSELLRIS